MGRYTGPKWKLCRREGLDLFSRGGSIVLDTPLKRRDYPPGVHAQRRTKVTEFGIRLREKQKLKRIYGIRERQSTNYYKKAARLKGDTGVNLLCMLERRLDAAITSAGFTKTIAQARQLIVHGHFQINGKRVTVPSYQIKPGEVITPRDKAGTNQLVEANLEINAQTPIPPWMERDSKAKTATIVGMPTRADFPYPIVESLIVEFYSR